ncbi:MAG TPA: hypothetical protein DCE47_17110 [Planctomycetaceae bacterium]|nr:hypothetical protein [Planctomycetaceae bacterium]HCD02659.1 hypothetical protein [Planctomycetaceae bacterium]
MLPGRPGLRTCPSDRDLDDELGQQLLTERDVFTPVQEVDHIKTFKGKRDPLGLDHTNLRSLCRSCHRKKHARG